MIKKFVTSIYESSVVENCNLYKDLFKETESVEQLDQYWKDALSLYSELNCEQKTVFFEVIKQTIIDTVSTVFGAIDGSVTLIGGEFECKLDINGISTDNELQDIFLELVEEQQISK